METLSKLFSGEARVKLMRLFLFNPDQTFTEQTITEKAKVNIKAVTAEVKILESAGMIKCKKLIQIKELKKKGKIKEVKQKVNNYFLNSDFEYLLPLQNLLINSRPLRKEEIVRRLSGVGKLKMVIVAGVFTQNPESRVDLLVVGDNLRRGALDRIVKNMESEIGKELNFAAFETADFHYRLGMYDKLVRDILDFPHQKLVDKLGLKN